MDINLFYNPKSRVLVVILGELRIRAYPGMITKEYSINLIERYFLN